MDASTARLLLLCLLAGPTAAAVGSLPRSRCCPCPTPLSTPQARPAAVVLCPLFSSVRRSPCRVTGLAAVAIKDRSRGGFSRLSSSALCGPYARVPVAGERIPALPIPGAPPSLRPTLIVVLINLRGQRHATTAAADEAPWDEEEAGRSSANGATGFRIE